MVLMIQKIDVGGSATAVGNNGQGGQVQFVVDTHSMPDVVRGHRHCVRHC